MRALSITITLVLTLAIRLSDVVPARAAALSLRAQAGAEPEIRLVLLIAVDQFRYDYLTRFRSEYTAGLAQLLTRGADFTNATLAMRCSDSPAAWRIR